VVFEKIFENFKKFNHARKVGVRAHHFYYSMLEEDKQVRILDESIYAL